MSVFSVMARLTGGNVREKNRNRDLAAGSSGVDIRLWKAGGQWKKVLLEKLVDKVIESQVKRRTKENRRIDQRRYPEK